MPQPTLSSNSPPDSGRLLQLVGRAFLKLTGWKLAGGVPANSQMVVIAAPHTTNWDFIYLIAAAISFRLKINWMGKASLFKPPLGIFMRWMGGISIDRSKQTNLVAQLTAKYAAGEHLAVVIPPSGTRSPTEYWKSGFYWIAREARVPIVCGYLDYPKRIAGLGLSFTPTDDIRADMDRIREFYQDIQGKYPSNASSIRLREETDPD